MARVGVVVKFADRPLLEGKFVWVRESHLAEDLRSFFPGFVFVGTGGCQYLPKPGRARIETGWFDYNYLVHLSSAEPLGELAKADAFFTKLGDRAKAKPILNSN
jgi:hypothetical protein